MHRKPTRFSLRTKILTVLTAALLAVLGFGLAASAAAKASVGLDANGVLHQCIQMAAPHNITANTNSANWATNKCPSGYTQLHYSVLPTGTATVSGTTNVTNWPESSGWATDAFTRSLTVTRSAGEVDNANCDGAAHCWFYTDQLVDNGGFTTVDGKPTPNGTGGTISGKFTGTMQGVASGSFYADSSAIAATNIPTGADGSAKPATTTSWGTLVLPNSAHTFHVKLTAYSWTYKAASTCEQWVDAFNPGDDGQSAGDGNITGTVHCTT